MKWASHKKITGKIGKFFGVEDLKALTEASVLPDKEYDYRVVRVKRRGRTYEKKVRLRHHLDPHVVGKIVEYTVEARCLRLRGKKSYVVPLGKAAHYIQDYVIDPRKKVLFFKFRDVRVHDRIEERIDKLEVPFDEVYRVKRMKFTFSDFRRELRRLRPSRDPEVAMRNAVYLTAMLVKLVVAPEYPDDFWERYGRVRLVSVVLVGAGAGVGGVSFLAHSSVGFAVGALFVAAGFLNPVFWHMRRDARFLRECL